MPHFGTAEADSLPWGDAVRLAATFLGVAQIDRIDCIGRRFAGVYRLHFPEGHDPATAILKCDQRLRLGDPAGKISREFLEECAVYELSGQLHSLGMIPCCYGTDPTGWILIEDLGCDRGLALPFDEVARRVVRSLAGFHRAMQPNLEGYSRARHALMLTDQIDTRILSHANSDARVSLGIRQVGDLIETLHASGWPQDDLLTQEFASIRTPTDYFPTLIHDDLVNQRQCVFRDGRAILIDFEMAKLGDGLTDLARLVIGKYERSLDTLKMMIAHSGFEPKVILDYMTALSDEPFVPERQRSACLAIERRMVRVALEGIGWSLDLWSQGALGGELIADWVGILNRTCAAASEIGPQLLLTEEFRVLAKSLESTERLRKHIA